MYQVFGAPPSDHATSKLPQHGFARTATWAFLGKSTSESDGGTAVKLDFGLSTEMLKEDVRAAWPYQFGLLYSVILSPDALEISLQVQNKGNERFEFHVLLHNYFTVPVFLSKTSPKEVGSLIFVRMSTKSASRTSSPSPTPTKPITSLSRKKRLPRSLSPVKPIASTSTSTRPRRCPSSMPRRINRGCRLFDRALTPSPCGTRGARRLRGWRISRMMSTPGWSASSPAPLRSSRLLTRGRPGKGVRLSGRDSKLPLTRFN